MALQDAWQSAVLKNNVQFMRYEAGLRQQILDMVDQLGRDLVADLANGGLETPRTDWQRARLRNLIAEAEKTVGTAYEDIAAVQNDGLSQGVKVSTQNLVAAMNEAAGVEVLAGVKWTPALLKALVDGTLTNGAPSAEWWGRQAADLVQAFQDQMRQAMLQGENLGSMVARLKDLMLTRTRQAEALVRTSAMAVNNAAQLATWTENASEGDLLQWDATLDPKTCLVCGAMDGQQWPVGEPHETAPLHWNCRCGVVPVASMWMKLGIERPAAQRAARGGPVDQGTTWEQWLGSLPKAEQQDILGPARWKLWDSGKLTLRDLVDQRGNVLTLEQLAG